MTLLLASEIAENLSPDQYVRLCLKVEKQFGQEFGIVSIEEEGRRSRCVIELRDGTQHTVAV